MKIETGESFYRHHDHEDQTDTTRATGSVEYTIDAKITSAHIEALLPSDCDLLEFSTKYGVFIPAEVCLETCILDVPHNLETRDLEKLRSFAKWETLNNFRSGSYF